ncbi:glycoside hydrolase superfamily [Zychaea mexicana]|uniref:glycoside hydrolase superfamily n=1 Tax=Zychaea mexicana TaxID=64656 RepID=UPI0022FDEDD6|nr:glycoside hydrolase superfamily [Zychaea mexicana]KAI9468673.1 glycoside hydrolase superfamily [Zychaea mexicana]
MAVAALLPGGVDARPTHHHDNKNDGFVKVNEDGTGFTRFGKPYMIRGANYWQGINLGAEECFGGDRERMETEIKQMADMGISNVRVMAASEGPDDQPYRMRPSLMYKPGEYREEIFVGLDYLMDVLDRYNMTAVMTLNNFWHWSGGFSQYVAWITGDENIPYPVNNTGWDEFTAYTAQFYNNSDIAPTAQKIYKDHIKTLANEPQQGPAWWFEETGTFIKELAPNHLVSVGLESKEDEFDFLRAHDHDVIDYTTCHLWVENRGVYDPSKEDSINDALTYGADFLTKTSGWAVDLGKPIVMEEFGMARDAWLQPNNLTFKYDPATPTAHKDEFFGALFDQIVGFAKKGQFSGSNFWAYSGMGRSTDYPNKYGMVWLGDPPHEPRGWYGVYDKDTTAKVISKYNSELQELEK